MYNNSLLTRSVRYALMTGAAAAALTAPAVYAAEGDEIERIEVTGSSIKRTDMEGALPVTVITSEDITRSGAIDTAELIQQLPSMQGFAVAADSVGGGGGSLQTASIHDLGASYTLVLVNGRRIAPSTSGSTIDLGSIPLAAIERVEVLTDGASALYGSDAIAGVVNFILKDNFQGAELSARYDKPQETGGESWNGSMTFGFGDVDTDGYNVMLSYTHDEQEQLASKDRDFAKTGMIPFQNNGQDYFFFNGSGNAIPANARVREAGGDWRAFNPYLATNGSCAENNSQVGANCFFDYTSTIEIVPESSRDTVFLNAQFEINDEMKLYAEAIYAKNSMTTRIAPYPTGYFPLPASSDLVSTYIVPHLTDAEKAAYDAGNLDVNARWRALPAGNRTTEYDTTAVHLVTGLEGNFGEFDYDFGLFYSSNDRDQDYPTGWLIRDKFVDVVSSGAVNVFVPGSELDAASAEALAPAIYHGNWNTTKVEVSGLDFKGSLPVFEMPAGEAYLGFGGDYRMTSYKRDISEANKNAELLFLSTGDVYDLERDSYGGFVELVVPVIEDLEVTASGRYDAIGGVDDKINGFTVNDTLDDFTYKLSARYQVTDELLLRASYGTGFKAPSMLGIAQPRQESGVTSDSYACPFPSGDPLAQYCLSGRSQYSVFTQGYANLKPETSEQYSVGFVYAPDSNFSITIDYWNVEMEDQVSSLSEAQIFGNPALYRDLFTTKRNLATNEDELAIIQADVNIGKSKNSGIDWDVRNNYELGWGDLSTYFVGTYMMESEYTLPGTDDVFVSSMGKFGENNSVTFRVISQIGATLTTGDFQNTLIAKYRSGYQDQFQSKGGCAVVTYTNGVLGDCVDIQLRVPSYTTFNYQGRYFVNDNLSVMAGVNNLFDKAPALSLRGGGSGHQVGYDPRYTDSYGRTYYIQADYKF